MLPLLALTALSLAACNPSANLVGTDDSASSEAAMALTPRQELATQYIKDNINDISPSRPLLGDSFVVTDVRWSDANTATVSYEDGEALLMGEVDVAFGDDGVLVKSFVLVTEGE